MQEKGGALDFKEMGVAGGGVHDLSIFSKANMGGVHDTVKGFSPWTSEHGFRAEVTRSCSEGS